MGEDEQKAFRAGCNKTIRCHINKELGQTSQMKKKETSFYLIYLTVVVHILISSPAFTQKNLHQLQQQFIDLRFGMFIHFNIPTFMNQDWPDPEASPAIFDPKKLDCNQWALAAKSANMTYGCLTTKHHSGFCIWNTQTTDYNVMMSPVRREHVAILIN